MWRGALPAAPFRMRWRSASPHALRTDSPCTSGPAPQSSRGRRIPHCTQRTGRCRSLLARARALAPRCLSALHHLYHPYSSHDRRAPAHLPRIDAAHPRASLHHHDSQKQPLPAQISRNSHSRPNSPAVPSDSSSAAACTCSSAAWRAADCDRRNPTMQDADRRAGSRVHLCATATWRFAAVALAMCVKRASSVSLLPPLAILMLPPCRATYVCMQCVCMNACMHACMRTPAVAGCSAPARMLPRLTSRHCPVWRPRPRTLPPIVVHQPSLSSLSMPIQNCSTPPAGGLFSQGT